MTSVVFDTRDIPFYVDISLPFTCHDKCLQNRQWPQVCITVNALDINYNKQKFNNEKFMTNQIHNLDIILFLVQKIHNLELKTNVLLCIT